MKRLLAITAGFLVTLPAAHAAGILGRVDPSVRAEITAVRTEYQLERPRMLASRTGATTAARKSGQPQRGQSAAALGSPHRRR